MKSAIPAQGWSVHHKEFGCLNALKGFTFGTEMGREIAEEKDVTEAFYYEKAVSLLKMFD